MRSVSQTTIKRLFALSQNRCAFPDCALPLVDPVADKVTGRICHIRAQSKKGPRYDSKQSEKQRNGFENLLLLCPVHHDIVDANVETYSVEHLLAIKRDHEQASQERLPISKDAIKQIIEHSIAEVSSSNQSGGQTAHTINNIYHGHSPKHIASQFVRLHVLSAAAMFRINELRSGGREWTPGYDPVDVTHRLVLGRDVIVEASVLITAERVTLVRALSCIDLQIGDDILPLKNLRFDGKGETISINDAEVVAIRASLPVQQDPFVSHNDILLSIRLSIAGRDTASTTLPLTWMQKRQAFQLEHQA